MPSNILSKPARVRVAPNLYQRSDGRYVCGYSDPATGKWRMVTLKQAETLTQAKRAAREILGKRDRRELVAPSRLTFGEVWTEYEAMFESLVASGEKSERTLELYRQRYRTHLEEPLGRLRIQNVSARHLSDVLATVRAKRIKRGGSEGEATPLSSWTVKSIFTLASSILQFAVTRHYRAENPVSKLAKAERPRARNQSEPRALTAPEIEQLIASALPTYRPLIATLAYSGLRMSEALGLTWQEIDFDADEIHVRYQLSRATSEKPARRKQLKSEAGARNVILLPQLETILREHRKAMLAAGLYRPDGYVFCTSEGTPFYSRNVSERGMDKAADRAGLNPEGKPRLTAHDLRHSFASLLIRAGADIYSVSRQLGHSRASTTLDLYAHLIDEVRNGVALRAQLAQAFGGGVSP
jgi:integrase